MDFGIPRNSKEFQGILRNEGVNFHDKFRLGIPNHNNSGSKNPHTTHNSSNRSDEGLTLETSAFLLLTVANLRFQPSC